MDKYIKIYDEGLEQGAELSKKLSNRNKMALPAVISAVESILNEVRAEGVNAVLRLTEKFDRVALTPANIEVTTAEMAAADAKIAPELRKALQEAAENIYRFHIRQLEQEQDLHIEESVGKKLSLLRRPLKRVGIYVPGGTGGSTPLPSSVLMNAIPAKAAGVKELIMCTPPGPDGQVNPGILVAAQLAGVDRIFKAGGAQAIAALAYGAGPIPAVDKICGPGNIYVNTAKRLVFGQVDIDMFAGPSEILLVADDAANPQFVARDLLSQAEHDPLASAILLTDSRELADAVQREIEFLLPKSDRHDILAASLRDYGAIVLVNTLQDALQLSNEIAPEHLELCVSDEKIPALLALVENAGAVFLGYYSPEPLGDYWAGANHVLPTSGSARFFSPLNTGDFIKKMSLIHYNKAALQADGAQIIRLAQSEGLACHAASIAIRMEEEEKR